MAAAALTFASAGVPRLAVVRPPWLAVDLGDALFTRRWWRGLATLLLLAFALTWGGARQTPLAEVPRAVSADPALGVAPLALGGSGALPAAWTPRAVRLAEPPERPRITASARLGGGGVARALVAGGVGNAEAASIAALIAGQVAQLPAGARFELVLGRRDTKAVPRPLESLSVRAAFDLKLAVARGADGTLGITRIPIAIDDTPLSLSARVGGSLARAARGLGAPGGVIAEFTRLLSHRLDFERDVRGRDRFTIVLEHRRAATGETQTGGLLYARLDRSKGDPIEMMRWPFGGRPQYFLADGTSVKKGLMRTPVDGARLTSGFGLRLHPILGYSRFHRGVDFGAASGTPIVAAAAGRVAFAGWHGGHGNYVLLAHGRGLGTAYGHMSRIGVRGGQAVAQGQVIGWVGSTGMSTGPHLHYEVWMNGAAVDPRGTRFVSGPVLGGSEFARFRAAAARLRGLGGGDPDA